MSDVYEEIERVQVRQTITVLEKKKKDLFCVEDIRKEKEKGPLILFKKLPSL